MPRVLVDTGPLVAWLDADDTHHAVVKRYLDTFDGELLSTWPVLTETCHLIPEHLVPAFMQWVAKGGLTVVELSPAAIPSIADRMAKYADLPVDLADASLVWLAENLGILDVLTLDKVDFGIYRTIRGKSLRNLLESGTPRSRRRPPSR